mmetsp:Transcript_24604/g.93002  ORF Transcript_24604/g.93002 Transcript_24604/m.93002 type:complete len:495 (-) Transcript_24604:3021-4505(-)
MSTERRTRRLRCSPRRCRQATPGFRPVEGTRCCCWLGVGTETGRRRWPCPRPRRRGRRLHAAPRGSLRSRSCLRGHRESGPPPPRWTHGGGAPRQAASTPHPSRILPASTPGPARSTAPPQRAAALGAPTTGCSSSKLRSSIRTRRPWRRPARLRSRPPRRPAARRAGCCASPPPGTAPVAPAAPAAARLGSPPPRERARAGPPTRESLPRRRSQWRRCGGNHPSPTGPPVGGPRWGPPLLRCRSPRRRQGQTRPRLLVRRGGPTRSPTWPRPTCSCRPRLARGTRRDSLASRPAQRRRGARTRPRCRCCSPPACEPAWKRCPWRQAGPTGLGGPCACWLRGCRPQAGRDSSSSRPRRDQGASAATCLPAWTWGFQGSLPSRTAQTSSARRASRWACCFGSGVAGAAAFGCGAGHEGPGRWPPAEAWRSRPPPWQCALPRSSGGASLAAPPSPPAASPAPTASPLQARARELRAGRPGPAAPASRRTRALPRRP